MAETNTPVKTRTIEEDRAEQGGYYGTTHCDSLEPLLHDRRQTLVLNPLTGRAKKHEVVLVKRDDGHYVLHRVVKVLSDGYLTRGDNRFHSDAPVREEQVLARLDGYYRGTTFVPIEAAKYRAYLAFWVKNPCRFLYLAARGGFRRVFKKK